MSRRINIKLVAHRAEIHHLIDHIVLIAHDAEI